MEKVEAEIPEAPADEDEAERKVLEAQRNLQSCKDEFQSAIDDQVRAYNNLSCSPSNDEANDALSKLEKLGAPLAEFATFCKSFSGPQCFGSVFLCEAR